MCPARPGSHYDTGGRSRPADAASGGNGTLKRPFNALLPETSRTDFNSNAADDPGEPTFRLDLAEMQIAAGQSEQALTTLRDALATGTLNLKLPFPASIR